MGKHTITFGLSQSSIQDAIKELRSYQNSLEYKCSLLAQKLADRGINVARNNTGNFGHHITFEKKVVPEKNGCTAIIVAKDISKIKSQWKTTDGIKSAEVSPLLMVEFGSGFKAKNPKNVQGVGQGTFPNQTHAFDEDGWYWVDLDGNLNHSYGIEPKMPMYNAFIEVQSDINDVVKEVFG